MQRGTNILLADDDANFVLLLRTAFEYADIPVTLTTVPDGAEAVRYLKKEGRFSDQTKYPVPDLLLLDLRLPRMDGLEVLHWIRSRFQFAELPVLMLTGTDREQEIEAARNEGVSDFLIKPFDFAGLTALVEYISHEYLAAPRLHAGSLG